ncbi:hypothetical protein [Streptomyces sp. NPDC007856]|uniref:hypothetical protein n=1 Tax=Streptomyces sp. NPDC007856 TaxID=3364781 RepID=UPI0036BC1775
MRWILFGALLGVLVAFPATATLVGTTVLAVVSQPLVIAFAAGALARPVIGRRVRGWTA